MRTLLLGFLLCLIVTSTSYAQIPETISYQGVLIDESGNPLPDDMYELTFNIYNSETGEPAVWTETQEVYLQNGLFNIVLGKVNPLSISFDQSYWLGITIGEGTELTPRIELTSSAYSMSSKRVIGDSNIFPSDGYVGIGTMTPEKLLHVGDYTVDNQLGLLVSHHGITLKGIKGTDALPYIEVRDENDLRAFYWGWGCKSNKYVDWKFENGYNLSITGQ